MKSPDWYRKYAKARFDDCAQPVLTGFLSQSSVSTDGEGGKLVQIEKC
jgi:hypothetical protein